MNMADIKKMSTSERQQTMEALWDSLLYENGEIESSFVPALHSIDKEVENNFPQNELLKLLQWYNECIPERINKKIQYPFRESDFQISNPLANEILKTGIRII